MAHGLGSMVAYPDSHDQGRTPRRPVSRCSLALSAYLRAVSNKLHSAGLQPFLPALPDRPPWAGSSDALDFGAPSWADDFALPQNGEDAEQLISRVQASAQLLVTHARTLGMVVKFGPEKTAALVSSMVIRPQHAQIVANADPLADGPYHLPLVDGLGGDHRLPIVEAYKHLGGIATSSCSPAPHLHHRFARASGTVKPLSRRLFSSHSFDQSVRRSLLRALTISKYVHTSAAFVMHAAVHQRLWDRQLVSLWRHLCRRESAEHQVHPYFVLQTARAPAPLALAHTRASFLCRLFKHGPRALPLYSLTIGLRMLRHRGCKSCKLT